MRYMLDTNIASHIIKGSLPAIVERLQKTPMADLFVSAITEAELLRGVARKPEAVHLPRLVNEFLLRVDSLPWDAANQYAQLRTACEKEGKSLSAMDMLIAAHAKAEGMVLVTNDQAFFKIRHLIYVEDWTR